MATAESKLDKNQYQLALLFEQEYWRTGDFPSMESLQNKGIPLTLAFWDLTLSNPNFRLTLQTRGIPDHLLLGLGQQANQGPAGLSKTEDELGKSLIRNTLSEEQIAVANIMLDVHDKRSRLKKLTELGVSTAIYNSWLRDPLYRDYCLSRAEDLLVSNQAVAHMSLISNVERGDLSSIKYFNAMTGRFREKAQAGVEVNVQNNYLGSDTLVKVVEIIQRHVKDPTTLDAIASDILALTQPSAPALTVRSELG